MIWCVSLWPVRQEKHHVLSQFVSFSIEGGFAEVGDGMRCDHKLIGRRSPIGRHGLRGRNERCRHNSDSGNARVF